MEKCQFFFDLEKGITLNFYQILKTLNFPAFTVKSKTYFSFFKSLVCGISLQYFLFHLSHDPPINDGDSINILRFVEKTKPIVNFAIPKNKKLSFDTLLNYLVSLSHLEEAELNFLNIPYVQKKSVVKSLNRNLKSIKITLFQPISFLLYIGKKFENLQTLDVGIFDENFTVEHLTKKNNKNFSLFKNLTTFRFLCNSPYKHCPCLLDTILTILNRSQKTLEFFELKFYNWSADVSKIISFICSKNIPLKCISLMVVKLFNVDIMNIVKLNKNKELIIKLYNCGGEYNRAGIKAALPYIEQNNLNKQIVWNRDILDGSTFQ